MELKKFLIQPDSANYTATDGRETLETKLDGGSSRRRLDVLNASYTVTASWTFTRAKFTYFRGFYKATTQRGSLPFLIDLQIDTGEELTEHQVSFVAGSVRTSQISGHMFKVDAQLEVMPNASQDEGYFANNVLLYELYGEDMFGKDLTGLFDDLHFLANIKIPSLEVFQND